MAYADRIDQPELGIQFVVRISGLPYLFSNAAAPVGWESGGVVTYDSEDYTWSATLLIDEDFAAVAQKVQPKGGLGEGGGLGFTFQTEGTGGDLASDVWLDLMQTNIRRADKNITTLTADLAADEDDASTGEIEVAASPWGTSQTTLYLGTETIIAGGGSSTSTKIVGIDTRGAYGSYQRHHAATAVAETETITTGVYISDYPLTLAGRFVELWVITGEAHGLQVTDEPTPQILGVGFMPYGDASNTLDDAEHKKIYAGVISDVGWTQDLTAVQVNTKGLTHLIDGPLVSRFPTFRAGIADTSYHVASSTRRHPKSLYLGPHNKYFFFEIFDRDARPRITVADVTALISAIGSGTVTLTIAGVAMNGNTTATGSYPGPTNGIFYVETSHSDPYDNAFWTAQWIQQDINGQASMPSWLTASYAGTTYPHSVFLNVASGITNYAAASMAVNDDSIVLSGASAETQDDYVSLDSSLRRDNSGMEDVPEGVYDVFGIGSDVSTYIADTIGEQLGTGYSPRVFVTWEPTEDNEEVRCRIELHIDPADRTRDWDVYLHTRRGQKESFLRDLGFSDAEIKGEQREDTGTNDYVSTRWVWLADRAPAQFRWPVHGVTTPSRLYLWQHEPGEWGKTQLASSTTGWTDDDGTTLDAYMVIDGVEVLRCSEGYTATGDSRWVYLDVEARAQMGSLLTEEVYVPFSVYGEQEYKTVWRVPGFGGAGVGVARMFLYMLAGSTGIAAQNGDYDQGWQGAGLDIPVRFINVASFEARHDETPERRKNWCILPGDGARDVFGAELVLCQWQVVAFEGQLHLVSIRPPLESETSAAPSITHAENLVTDLEGEGVKFDRSNVRLVNVLNAQANFNNATKKFQLTIKNRSLDSIANFGEQTPLTLKVRGIRSTVDADAAVAFASKRIFDRYGKPYAVIEGLAISTREAWSWQIGTPVTLTHDALPEASTVDRGVDTLPCVVMGTEAYFLGRRHGETEMHGRVALISHAYHGGRRGEWAPSMLGLSTSDGGQTWAVDDDKYGDGSPKDHTYFTEGWYVTAQKVGDASTATQARIQTITNSGTPDASTVLLYSSLGWTDATIFFFTDYDDGATRAAQQAYAYQSAGDGTLDAGDAAAYDYL